MPPLLVNSIRRWMLFNAIRRSVSFTQWTKTPETARRVHELIVCDLFFRFLFGFLCVSLGRCASLSLFEILLIPKPALSLSGNESAADTMHRYRREHKLLLYQVYCRLYSVELYRGPGLIESISGQFYWQRRHTANSPIVEQKEHRKFKPTDVLHEPCRPSTWTRPNGMLRVAKVSEGNFPS